MAGRRAIGRRALASSALLLGGAALLEWQSLRGRFDHRKPAATSVHPRYAASRDAIASRSLSGVSDEAGAALVHIGHSTHLIVAGGLRILTDPWFSDPAFGALSHERPPAARPSELGPLDVILVSHDHADHADLRAMDQMDKRALVLVATPDLRARVRRLGYRQVDVLSTWEAGRERGVTFTAVPAQHDIHEIGFVIEGGGKSVYFAGDTRLHPELAAIAERFHPDMAILPVDGTRLTGGALHVMTPEDAVTAARTLGSRVVVPSHAEAIFTDAVASTLLASTVAGAREQFARAMGAALPGVRCVVPGPGTIVLA